jgi:hypothetical protein
MPCPYSFTGGGNLPWATTGGRPYIWSEGVSPSIPFLRKRDALAPKHPRFTPPLWGALCAPASVRVGSGRTQCAPTDGRMGLNDPPYASMNPVTSLARPLPGKGQKPRQTHRSTPTDGDRGVVGADRCVRPLRARRRDALHAPWADVIRLYGGTNIFKTTSKGWPTRFRPARKAATVAG